MSEFLKGKARNETPGDFTASGSFCCCMYELLLIRLFFYAADRAT